MESGRGGKKNAYVRMLEQPASKGLRFRYECEGRSAGSIPGTSSTADTRTFPAIQVVGYTGKAVVVVSCVTVDPPYRPHPHNLVGKEGCKKGVCTIHLGEDMTVSFPNLGIQCVKKKDIDESLSLRQEIRVDPFHTGFSHKTNPQNIDLNCVRLAFQVFLEGKEGPGAFTFALKPVVSDPIFDKKAKCDLTICRLTETSGPVAGGKEILLFCDKITKDDIQVRFFEEKAGQLVWEGFGDFQPSDVHKQYGICFRTPRYRSLELEQPVEVSVQLRRPSDGAVSESRAFEFIPLDAGRAYWSAKRLKTNYSVFSQILSRDQAVRQGGAQLGQTELRHKLPLGRAPVMAGLFTETGEPDPGPTRLRPVAMPGGGPASSLQPLPAQTDTEPVLALAAQPVPARAALPPLASPPGNVRPTSDLSLLSELSGFTQCDAASLATRQSVGEILSLADMSVYSGDTAALDSLSVSTLLQEPAGPGLDVKLEPELGREPAAHLGSLTSVATVREVKPDPASGPAANSIVELAKSATPPIESLDMDIGQIYDDVMQCVYDDVDVKYDDMNLLTDQTEAPAPVPPLRRRGLSVDQGVEKPLPITPRNNIISKLAEKKNVLLTAREKELEKKRLIDEQRKREKEEQEEQRRKEREEKERKRQEEREAKRLEEEQKRAQKKKEDEEKKAKQDEEQKMKTSLFQRLFQRSQSRPGEVADCLEEGAVGEAEEAGNCPPPVPPHQTLATQQSLENQLSDLEQLIQSGELERLDSVVSEFASQFPPEAGSGDCPELTRQQPQVPS